MIPVSLMDIFRVHRPGMVLPVWPKLVGALFGIPFLVSGFELALIDVGHWEHNIQAIVTIITFGLPLATSMIMLTLSYYNQVAASWENRKRIETLEKKVGDNTQSFQQHITKVEDSLPGTWPTKEVIP